MRKAYSQQQVIKTNELAKIIGDSSNILILYELVNFGEKSFNELKRMTSINAVTLTKKLTFLKDYGLVQSHRAGKENHYCVTKKTDDFVPLIKDIERLVIKV